jgi:hypothetical protein
MTGCSYHFPHVLEIRVRELVGEVTSSYYIGFAYSDSVTSEIDIFLSTYAGRPHKLIKIMTTPAFISEKELEVIVETVRAYLLFLV